MGEEDAARAPWKDAARKNLLIMRGGRGGGRERERRGVEWKCKLNGLRKRDKEG